jgi:predicted lipoprotein
MHVMQRVQPQEAADAAPLFGWLAGLSAPLRTALASLLVLVAFVGAFWLMRPAVVTPVVSPAALARANAAPEKTLAAVPRTEVVRYLLSDAAPRLTLNELAETPLADRDLTPSFLPGSDADVQAALDEELMADVYL